MGKFHDSMCSMWIFSACKRSLTLSDTTWVFHRVSRKGSPEQSTACGQAHAEDRQGLRPCSCKPNHHGDSAKIRVYGTTYKTQLQESFFGVLIG